MNAVVDSDPNNTNRKIVRRQVDFGVRDVGEVSFDFVADTTSVGLEGLIATRRSVSFSSVSSGGVGAFTLSSPHAFLTSVSYQAQVGDLVRGSLTFKLSDQG